MNTSFTGQARDIIACIEKQISNALSDDVLMVSAYNYVVLFNERIVSYIDERRPGWALLRKKYASLFFVHDVVDEEYHVYNWNLRITRTGSRVKFNGFSGKEKFSYIFSNDIITAWLEAMRTEDGLIRALLTYMVTAHLCKLQNRPEIGPNDYDINKNGMFKYRVEWHDINDAGEWTSGVTWEGFDRTIALQKKHESEALECDIIVLTPAAKGWRSARTELRRKEQEKRIRQAVLEYNDWLCEQHELEKSVKHTVYTSQEPEWETLENDTEPYEWLENFTFD